eukprot:Hpha_TRINITY_DN13544_c0_g1::TRINITY_DN13544_c0_g1_i1::g.111374::m.111374
MTRKGDPVRRSVYSQSSSPATPSQSVQGSEAGGGYTDGPKIRWLEQTIDLQAKALRERDETVERLESRLAAAERSDGGGGTDNDQWLVERVVDEQQRAAGLERQLRDALALLSDREKQLQTATAELKHMKENFQRCQTERKVQSLAAHTQWARSLGVFEVDRLPAEQVSAAAVELSGRRTEVLELAKRLEDWFGAIRLRCCRAGPAASANGYDSSSPQREGGGTPGGGGNPLDGAFRTVQRDLRRESRRLVSGLMRRLRGEASLMTDNALAHTLQHLAKFHPDAGRFDTAFQRVRRLVRKGIGNTSESGPWLRSVVDPDNVLRRLDGSDRQIFIDSVREVVACHDSHPRGVRSSHAGLLEELLANEHAIIAVLRVCSASGDADGYVGPSSIADLSDLPLPRGPDVRGSPPGSAGGRSRFGRSRSAQHPPPRHVAGGSGERTASVRRPSPHPVAGRSLTQQYQQPSVPPPLHHLKGNAIRRSTAGDTPRGRQPPGPSGNQYEQPGWERSLRAPSPTTATRRRSHGTPTPSARLSATAHSLPVDARPQSPPPGRQEWNRAAVAAGIRAPPPSGPLSPTQAPRSKDRLHPPPPQQSHGPRRGRGDVSGHPASAVQTPMPLQHTPSSASPAVPTCSVSPAIPTGAKAPAAPVANGGTDWAKMQRQSGLGQPMTCSPPRPSPAPTPVNLPSRPTQLSDRPSPVPAPAAPSFSSGGDMMTEEERKAIREQALGTVEPEANMKVDRAARSKFAEELRAWSSNLGTNSNAKAAPPPPAPPPASAAAPTPSLLREEAWAEDDEDVGLHPHNKGEEYHPYDHHDERYQDIPPPRPPHVNAETPEEREARKLREDEEDRQQDLRSPVPSLSGDEFDVPFEISPPDYADELPRPQSCIGGAGRRSKQSRVCFS